MNIQTNTFKGYCACCGEAIESKAQIKAERVDASFSYEYGSISATHECYDVEPEGTDCCGASVIDCNGLHVDYDVFPGDFYIPEPDYD